MPLVASHDHIITEAIRTFIKPFALPSEHVVDYITYLVNIPYKLHDSYKHMLRNRYESSLLQHLLVTLLKKQLPYYISSSYGKPTDDKILPLSPTTRRVLPQLQKYLDEQHIKYKISQYENKLGIYAPLSSYAFLTKFKAIHTIRKKQTRRNHNRSPFTQNYVLRPLLAKHLSNHKVDWEISPNLTNDDTGPFKLSILDVDESVFFDTFPFMKQYERYIIFESSTMFIHDTPSHENDYDDFWNDYNMWT